MSQTFTLNAFGGGAGPEGLAADLRRLLEVPEPVRDVLWEVIERNLGVVVPAPVQAFVQGFCQQHGVHEDALVPIVRACRALFRQGATRDIAVAEMTQDLNLLCGTSPEVVRRVSAWYERALPLVRSMLVADTLDDFGAVLQKSRIRTSYVRASQHLPNMLVPMVTLSLRYTDGGNSQQLTLQLPPAALEELRAALKP